MNALVLLKKVPWRHVCKYGGATLVGVGSVLGAMDADEKVQKMLKLVANKVVKN